MHARVIKSKLSKSNILSMCAYIYRRLRKKKKNYGFYSLYYKGKKAESVYICNRDYELFYFLLGGVPRKKVCIVRFPPFINKWVTHCEWYWMKETWFCNLLCKCRNRNYYSCTA